MIMTFGKPRYNSHYDYELLRLCSKRGLQVCGGASKLFSTFVKENPDASVISYCNISKFSGDVYTKIGMTLKETTKPAKIWSKDHLYVTDNLLRQRGFDQLFGARAFTPIRAGLQGERVWPDGLHFLLPGQGYLHSV